MKNLKRMVTLFLALAMALALSAPGFAAGTGYSDVSPDAWYAGAVDYVTEHDLMNGVGGGRFDPEGSLTRAQLATVLYRMEDEPAVTGEDYFTDTESGVWYSNAVLWASQSKLMEGYGGDIFGTDDPVTRQDMTTVFYRYANSPAVDHENRYEDESAIANYASAAVDWAAANGIVRPASQGVFEPRVNATRAQVADALMNYHRMTSSTPGGKTLVVYFSASGNTGRVAGYIAEALGADQFELVPANPYTSADLNWTDPDSRVNDEHNDETLRDVKLTANTVDNWADYDTVFIGYPIWWGIAAWPVNDFVKNNDFTGKTVIPFCTSSSSGLGQSGELLADMAGTGDWQAGQRFSSGASQQQVAQWLNGLGLG